MSRIIIAILFIIGIIAIVFYKRDGATFPNPSPTPTQLISTTQQATNMKQYNSYPETIIDQNKQYTVTLVTTKGTLKIKLFPKEVPKTVNNFVFLVKDGFYNGVKFHRIIKGFMIQTGDPKGDGTGGSGYKFEDEPVTKDYKRGVVAMANSGPNTNGSQFFIMHQDYPLPKNYTIFGEVIEGIDVVDKIANTPVTVSFGGEQSSPTEEIKIESSSVEEL